MLLQTQIQKVLQLVSNIKLEVLQLVTRKSENIIDSASSTEDSVEIQEGGVAYKVNDALTIGVYAANMDYVTVASTTDNGVETGMGIVQVGYNLGPAVIQYDYADGSEA